MNFQPRPHLTTGERHLPFDCIALVLQGGGALGAYQGGVYEALAEIRESGCSKEEWPRDRVQTRQEFTSTTNSTRKLLRCRVSWQERS